MQVIVKLEPADLVGPHAIDVDAGVLEGALAAKGKDVEWLCAEASEDVADYVREAVANHDIDVSESAWDVLSRIGITDL